jgi:hypothetical protein
MSAVPKKAEAKEEGSGVDAKSDARSGVPIGVLGRVSYAQSYIMTSPEVIVVPDVASYCSKRSAQRFIRIHAA